MDRFHHFQDISMHTSCRTCMETLNDTHHDIFATPDLLKKFSVCTSLLVEPGDEYPTSLCEPCYTKMNDFYDFKQMCLAATERYQEYIYSNNKPCSLESDSDPNNEKQLIVREYIKDDTDQRIECGKFDISVIKSEHASSPKTEELENEDDDQEILKYDGSFQNSDQNKSKLHAFKNTDTTKKVQQVKTRKTNLRCKICNKLFKRVTDLQRHLRVHNDHKPYPCSYCKKSFNRTDHRAVHEKTHTKQCSYECDICHRKFNVLTSLKKHIKVHQQAVNGDKVLKKSFTCQLCYKSFAKPNILKDHINEHEISFKETGSFEYSAFVDDKLSNVKNKPTFKKNKLNKSDEVIVKYDPETDNDSNNDTSKFNENEEANIETNTVTFRKTDLKCEICKQLFLKTETLERHMRVHNGLKPYLCSYCGKSVAKELKLHERIHTQQRPFECNVCHIKFTTPFNLRRHEIIHLNDDRPDSLYKCNVCNKSLSTLYSLKRHQKKYGTKCRKVRKTRTCS